MTGRIIGLSPGADLAGFRQAARRLVADAVVPGEVVFEASAQAGLFAPAMVDDAPPLVLPRAAADLIELVVCHRDPERYALLYQMVWRLLHGERMLLEVHSDPLVHRLEMMRKAIRRDLHKMHAFLRFRRVEGADERYAAWFEPDHHIVEATAQFFVDRFRALTWSIFTPDASLHWDRQRLTVGPGGRIGDAPSADQFEDGWLGYYESTFNPARLNQTAMRAEMPKKYWRNMPEARAIPGLVESAPARVRAMIEKEAAMAVRRDPQKAVAAMSRQEPQTLAELNAIIAAAEPLVPGAPRAVLGEGPVPADIAFVGEQPGDQEDIEGRPFVGPAGQLLDRAMAQAGIDRTGAYLTNAVKHFKFEQRGKRRIHQKPTTGEVKHYRWWLMKELDFVRPKLVVALGATAALSLTGKAMAVTRSRGPARFGDHNGYLTVHPSYLLRLPDETERARAYQQFVADLRRVHEIAGDGSAARVGG